MAGYANHVRLPNGGIQGFPVKWKLNGYPRVREVVCRVDGAITFGLDAVCIQMLPTVTLPIERLMPTRGKPASAADLTWSPANTPSPPE